MRGIYLLHIVVERSQEIAVGSLGRIAFPAGSYVYVGSAQNGLEARLARHLRKRKKRHWHIDYLLSARRVTIADVVCAEAARSQECEVARLLAAAARPVRGFGSSGCPCPGHLFATSTAPDWPSLGGLRWQAAGCFGNAAWEDGDQVWPTAAMPPGVAASPGGRACTTRRPKHTAVSRPRSVSR